MSRSSRYNTIILRTIDIGEADRLCILFTREGGRKAGKARSVRKMNSRLGGTLLPFRHITVELSETEHHTTITGAIDRNDLPDVASTFEVFVRLQRGIEFLLALTEDDEPLPKVFDLLLQLLRLAPQSSEVTLLAFQLRLLHLLGHLPESDEDLRFRVLSDASKEYVKACGKIEDLKMFAAVMPEYAELERFVRIVSGEQLQRPLKSQR